MSRFNNPDKNLDMLIMAKKALKREIEEGHVSYFAHIYVSNSLSKAQLQLNETKQYKEHLETLPQRNKHGKSFLGNIFGSEFIEEYKKSERDTIREQSVSCNRQISALENAIIILQQMEVMIDEFECEEEEV